MIDIFELIKHVENFDHEYYNQLNAEDKKGISFYLLQRWLASTTNSKQILYLNRFVNRSLYDSKNKEFLYKLFCCCTQAKNGKYKWVKKATKTKNETLKLIILAYNCGIIEAEQSLQLLSKSDILEMCEELNIDKPTLDKIKKEND